MWLINIDLVQMEYFHGYYFENTFKEEFYKNKFFTKLEVKVTYPIKLVDFM